MSMRRVLPAAGVAAVLAFAAVSGTGFGQGGVTATQSPPKKERVLVEDNYFDPRSTEIVAGGEVIWRWRGENKHSIRFTKVPARAGRKGAKLRAEGKWKRKFHRPGVYRYVCTVWSGMRGSVTVRKERDTEPND